MNRLSLLGTAIDGQLGLFEQQADSWKTDQDPATACLDIDAITNFGLGIYKSIRHADQAWSEAIRSGVMDPGVRMQSDLRAGIAGGTSHAIFCSGGFANSRPKATPWRTRRSFGKRVCTFAPR